jgi:hypothetical protein
MDTRELIHVLVDELPDRELAAAGRFLEFLKIRANDPLRFLLDAAPPDDEPVTEDDLASIREGLAEFARGDVVPHDEVKGRLVGGPVR